MALFGIQPVTDAQVDADIATPVGVLRTGVTAGALQTGAATPQRSGFTAVGDTLVRWVQPDVTAELLIRRLQPAVPPGMRVDGCYGAIWRLRAARDLVSIRVECAFIPSGHADGGPTSGEGLDAQTWRVGTHQVSIGTEDGESLARRAEQQAHMPARLREDFGLSSVVLTDRGLLVPVPSLRSGELVQLHFVLAWVHSDDDGQSPTWFAVDQPWHRVLDGSGCEGRAG